MDPFASFIFLAANIDDTCNGHDNDHVHLEQRTRHLHELHMCKLKVLLHNARRRYTYTKHVLVRWREVLFRYAVDLIEKTTTRQARRRMSNRSRLTILLNRSNGILLVGDNTFESLRRTRDVLLLRPCAATTRQCHGRRRRRRP
jgi:hypothetical protein